jgi:hypothetical protein
VERIVLNALAELRLCRLATCALGDEPIVLGEADPPLMRA